MSCRYGDPDCNRHDLCTDCAIDAREDAELDNAEL